MNLQDYYEKAHSGNKVENKEILQYISTYAHVIIWGGSYLGKAIGKYLNENGIKVENYWDLRADEIGGVNGIKVIQPFSTQDKENTIVIFCIGNNVIRGGLLKNLKNQGYENVVRGDYLYMGTVCPFDKETGIESSICQGTMCCRSIFCQRLSNIIKGDENEQEKLHMFSVTLIINSRCSLKCKCCTSYMNEYPMEKRCDVPLDRIKQDIDKFFEAMDSVGTVTVMGGEPFMHKDLAHIVSHLLTKKNFGLISIATSGTYPIKQEQLEGLKNNRVNVSFSNYEQSITERQKEIVNQNIELIQKNNISYTLGVVMPEWSVPSTLYNLNESEETMIGKKARCIQPPRCMQIKDGKLHPCDFGTAVYSLGIADYEMDYVDIENTEDKGMLKEKIRQFINQPYYDTCGHCLGMQGLTSKAAEQGYLDFTKPLTLQSLN